MSERERCPRCNSPDFVPYKFDVNTASGFILARQHPNARKCMDCSASVYNYQPPSKQETA